MSEQDAEPLPVKDENGQRPIAGAWRRPLCEVVRAFATGDYSLRTPVEGVAPIRAAAVRQIAGYLADYGETLVDLPDDAWATSISQWMLTHWEILVDLWTAESGPSDLVLAGRVFETSEGFRIEVDSIHVP
jgi:hypothetical protein